MAALYFCLCFILNLTLVAGQSVHYVLKGKDAFLSPALPSAPDDILWKHNGDKVITFDSAEEHVFRSYEGRVTLSWHTAELTITDMGYEDSGEYELDALIRDRLHRSQYMLKVLDKVSKPVIRCEMNEESGNSTSVRHATLHCSSDSNTPEALTFKWNLEGKSQLGQALTIALGNEHDHMEYSCTATNPLHGETSIFTAKDCYTDTSSEALAIIVPIVIASLILLSFCILAGIFRHQIKRACLNCGRNDDVEKQRTVADSNNQQEGTPLMGDIHRQETVASKQPLIQQNKYMRETPQNKDMKNVLDDLRSSKKFQKRSKKFTDREETESQPNTETEEKNDTDIGEMATPQLSSPVSNGQVQSEGATNLSHEDHNTLKSKGSSDGESSHSDPFHDAPEQIEPQEPGAHESREQTGSEGEPDVYYSDPEGGPNTDAAGGSSSIDSDLILKEAPKNPQQAEEENDKDIHNGQVQSEGATNLSHEDLNAPKSDKEPQEPGEHESRGQTDSEGEPDVHHSDHEVGSNTVATGGSSSIDSGQQEDPKTPQQAGSEPQLPHQSNTPELGQHSKFGQDEPEHKEQTDTHEESAPETDASHTESMTSEHKEVKESEPSNDSQMSLPQSERSESQPPPQSSPLVDKVSKSETGDLEDEKKTDPEDKLKTAENGSVTSEHEGGSEPQLPQHSQSEQDELESKEPKEPQEKSAPETDASRNESVTSEHKEAKEPEPSNDSQISLPQSEQSGSLPPSPGTDKDEKKTDPEDKLKTMGNGSVTSEHEAAVDGSSQPDQNQNPDSGDNVEVDNAASQSGQSQNPESGANLEKTKGSTESSPQSPASVHDSKSESTVQIDPGPAEKEPQTVSDHKSESSDSESEKAALPQAASPPPVPSVDSAVSQSDQNLNPGASEDEAEGNSEAGSSADKEQQRQHPSMEESGESNQTSPTAITPTADSELPGSASQMSPPTHQPPL